MLQDGHRDQNSADQRTAGLLAFNVQRRQDSRDRLIAAAVRLFCRDSYGTVGIEDIAAEAGVSRITFYRHFTGKAALALALFEQAWASCAGRMLAIAARDYRDRGTVIGWLGEFFAGDRQIGGLLRVLAQANVEEPSFSRQVQPFIFELIAALGQTIPAFAVTPGPGPDQVRWVGARLLIYTICDQSNHAATDTGLGDDRTVIAILADQFLTFVRTHDRVT